MQPHTPSRIPSLLVLFVSLADTTENVDDDADVEQPPNQKYKLYPTESNDLDSISTADRNAEVPAN
jgi:hypothetical protein